MINVLSVKIMVTGLMNAQKANPVLHRVIKIITKKAQTIFIQVMNAIIDFQLSKIVDHSNFPNV